MEKVDLKEKYIRRTEYFRVWDRDFRKHATPYLSRHEGYEWLLMHSGQCFFQIEEKIYNMKKDDMLFWAEGEYHGIYVPHRCAYTFFDFRPNLIFGHPDFIGEFVKPFQGGLLGGSHKIKAGAELAAAFRRLARTVRGGRDAAPAHVWEILGLIGFIPKLKLSQREKRLRDRSSIQPALDLIFSRCEEDLSVGKMAGACGMSKMTFYRNFFRATQKTPNAYLQEYRLNLVGNLLATTDRKISDIALSAGFLNQSYFNRAFLRHTGLTPLNFRKKHSSL